MANSDAVSAIEKEIERRQKTMKPYEPGKPRWTNGFVDGLKWALKQIKGERK